MIILGLNGADHLPQPFRVTRKRIAAVAACLSALILAISSADAYRFFADGRRDRSQEVSEYAVRWSVDVWGPGETLVFDVAPDPSFDVYFDSPEGVVPYLERALGAWAGIPTADISWRVGGVSEDTQAYEDGRNTIFINYDAGFCGGHAGAPRDRSSTRPKIVECDVAFTECWAEIPEDVEPDFIEEYRERRREGSVSLMVHEFGHCLGLGHAGALSVEGRAPSLPNEPLVHPRDPVMSYGWGHEEPEGLFADDVIGASLLRPVAGWLRRTGSISGSLSLSDAPAAFAHMWALPVSGDPLRDRIGTFANRDGEFEIEGLEAGEYALWAQPIYRQGANSGLVTYGEAPTDLDDTVLARLVRVRAGKTTEGVDISMRRGRNPRQPPEPALAQASQESAPPISITNTWGSPCAGIRIRAERPYPADGPRWFARPHWSGRADRWLGSQLTIEWSSEAGDAAFDWIGPYRDWRWDYEDDEPRYYVKAGEGETVGANLGARSPTLDISISHYRIERTGSVVRHNIEMAWPEGVAASLRFRSKDDACDGEPLVVCDLSGCDIRS